MEGLITLIVVFALVGFCLWLVLTYVPMPEPVKQGLIVIIVVLVILWIARWIVAGMPMPGPH